VPGDGDGDGDGDSGPDSWIYVQTTVSSPEGRTSFLQLVDQLNFDELDISNALELAGNARVFSDGRRLFTGGAEQPIIQAWVPEANGSLTPGERLSLANLGLSFVPFGNNFVRDDKAYLFDGTSLRAVVWNPDALTVTGEIDLLDLDRDGGRFLPEIDPGVLRGNELFALVQQNDFATASFFRGVRVLILDTEDDTFELIEDTRCVGGFSGIQLAEDGTVYVVGDNYLVYGWSDDTLPPTCVLRILPGERRFDPDFQLDLEAIVGGPATGFFYAGNGLAYTQFMDENATDIDPRREPLSFLNEPVATWWEIDLNDLAASRALTALGLSSPRSGPGFRLDGRVFIQRSEAGFAGDTELVEVSQDGSVSGVFDVVGLVVGLGRVDNPSRDEEDE